ncbi:hypothetical protein [Flavobacterium sp.]|uniref:hypothetical protein n=1 Tax=Flavobacterium sp. TaxID=239 RepID=UPI00286E22C3|nr:hypothetical protein [Flavobacterium sp.]
MKKYHFILIVVLGLFPMPDSAIACGKGSEKSCCKKEISSTKKEKKSCCGSDSSKKKDHKGCKGKCGHSECGCSSTCPASSVSFLSEINLKNNMFNYSSIEKVKFSYTTPSISDGFYSIWLIPKIS